MDTPRTLKPMDELETFAQALGRTRKELQEQIDRADNPKAEHRRLEGKAARAQRAIERREKQRELDRFTEDARDRYEQLRTVTDAEMQQARNGLSLGRQIDRALADASLLTAVGASEPGGTSHSKPEGRAPARIEGALYSHGRLDVETTYRRVLERIVAALWREVDGARRGSLLDVRKLESSAEKDQRLLRDWEGIRSEVVSVLDPSLGSPRSIEQMRRRNGRRPIDGTLSKTEANAA